jgi:hypothetical protein
MTGKSGSSRYTRGVCRCLVALFAIPASPVPIRLARDSVFVATVADASTNAPITGADVVVSDLARSSRTNWIGEATISGLSPGRHHVEVRRLGYAPAALDVLFDRDTVGVFFRLGPVAEGMDTVKVVAKVYRSPMLDEFDARRRMGIGYFVTDSVLRADSLKPIATIIEQHLPGFRSILDGKSVLRFGCEGHLGGLPDVYLNGFRWPSDVTDLRLYVGIDVAGVEYYRSASAPVQYRPLHTSPCGVLLIWTR